MINYYNFWSDLHKKIPHMLQILPTRELDATDQHTKQEDGVTFSRISNKLENHKKIQKIYTYFGWSVHFVI